jgi:hypothetical protein
VSGMRTGFHAHSGWYFRRDLGGNVVIEVAESDHVDAPLRVAAVFDPDTWASAVASVAAEGETSATFYAAQALHMGEPQPRRS